MHLDLLPELLADGGYEKIITTIDVVSGNEYPLYIHKAVDRAIVIKHTKTRHAWSLSTYISDNRRMRSI